MDGGDGGQWTVTRWGLKASPSVLPRVVYRSLAPLGSFECSPPQSPYVL